MSNHTPTPWIYSIQTNGKKSTMFCQSEPAAIGTVSSPEDAEHIVKCVNAHDELVDMVEALANMLAFVPEPLGVIDLQYKAAALLAKVRQ